MSSPEEWCRTQLANLQIKDLQKTTLNEIKNHLTKLPTQESITTSHCLQLPAIFDCLNNAESEQTKLACDVLSICMTNLDLGESVNSHSSLLEKSLYHENPDVKLLGINELLRIASHEINLISDINLIIAVIKTIDCIETKVGTASISLLTKILPNYIEIGDIKSVIDNIMIQSNDVVKCRIYEVGIRLCMDTTKIENTDFILRKMIDDYKENTDILVQLNILELLGGLTKIDDGLLYLENKGFIEYLIKKIESANENPLMITGLMKFFGTVASIHPSKMFNKYPSIISSLLDCIIAKDVLNLSTALDTLGHLATTTDGKIFLNSVPGHKMENVLKELSNSVNSFPTELKIRSLSCLFQLFESDNFENNQIVTITEGWFNYFSSTADLNIVFHHAKNSFPDIKMSGLNLLKSIIKYKWGQMKLLNTAGFIEFLLDRKVEFNKDVLHAKFEIIKILSESKNFDNDQLNEFRKYVNEGAFYIKPVTEVAIEGSM